jgi:hypothetical protein
MEFIQNPIDDNTAEYVDDYNKGASHVIDFCRAAQRAGELGLNRTNYSDDEDDPDAKSADEINQFIKSTMQTSSTPQTKPIKRFNVAR